MPSIKEKDLVDPEKKAIAAIGGVLLFTIAVFSTTSDDVNDDSLIIWYLFVGAVGLFIASCKKYKGKINVLKTAPNSCPDPQCNGTLELYDLLVRQTTQRHYRVIYTRYETRSLWERRMHCMACEADFSLTPTATATETRPGSNAPTTTGSSSNESGEESIPVAQLATPSSDPNVVTAYEVKTEASQHSPSSTDHSVRQSSRNQFENYELVRSTEDNDVSPSGRVALVPVTRQESRYDASNEIV